MGKINKIFIENKNIYGCYWCETHLTSLNELLSKAFCSASGKAYLFNKVINLNIGQEHMKNLTTGLHTISSVYCINCNMELGWKYEHAYKDSEKYKINRTILEKNKIKKLNWN